MTSKGLQHISVQGLGLRVQDFQDLAKRTQKKPVNDARCEQTYTNI